MSTPPPTPPFKGGVNSLSDAILTIAIFFLVGAGMAGIPIILSFLLWRKRKRVTRYKVQDTSRELEPYESGMPPVGPGRAVGFEYFIYAILFLFLDVVAVMLFLGVLAVKSDKSTYLWPLFTLLGLTFLLIGYGVKKREYFKI